MLHCKCFNALFYVILCGLIVRSIIVAVISLIYHPLLYFDASIMSYLVLASASIILSVYTYIFSDNGVQAVKVRVFSHFNCMIFKTLDPTLKIKGFNGFHIDSCDDKINVDIFCGGRCGFFIVCDVFLTNSFTPNKVFQSLNKKWNATFLKR